MKYYTRTETATLTGMSSNLETAWNEVVQAAETPQKPAPGDISIKVRGYPVHMRLAERGKVQTWKIREDSFDSLRLIAGEYPTVPKGRQWLSMSDLGTTPAILTFEKARPLWEETLLPLSAQHITPQHNETTLQLSGRDVRVGMFKAPSATLYVHKDSIENLLRHHAEQQSVPDVKVESAVHKGMQALAQKELKGRRGF